MEHVEEIIEQVSGTLADLARSDVVVGDPMQVGNVMVVPICRVSAGFGGGGETGSGGALSAQGAGSGGGALVRPVAVVIFREEGVEILPIPERQGKLEKLLDQIPSLIEKAKKKSEGSPK